MARVTRKRSERSAAHADKRLAEIKEVAAKWFYQKGYEGTELRAIARDLDMHAGSLYNYIECKEELLFLIMKDALEEGIVRIAEDAARAIDPAEKLRTVLRAYVWRHAAHKEATFTSETEIRALTGAYREEIFELRRRYEALWLQIVEEGVAAGVFRPVDVRVTVYAILSLPWSMPLWYDESGRLTPEEVIEQYVDLILYGLLQPTSTEGVVVGEPAAALAIAK